MFPCSIVIENNRSQIIVKLISNENILKLKILLTKYAANGRRHSKLIHQLSCFVGHPVIEFLKDFFNWIHSSKSLSYDLPFMKNFH